MTALGPRQEIIAYLACLWAVCRVTSADAYPDMSPRMCLVDEPISDAILNHYFSPRPIHPSGLETGSGDRERPVADDQKGG